MLLGVIYKESHEVHDQQGLVRMNLFMTLVNIKIKRDIILHIKTKYETDNIKI